MAFNGITQLFKRKPEKFGSATDRAHLTGFFSPIDAVLPAQGPYHLERKKAILKAHPEIEQLFGNDPMSAVLVVIFVAVLHNVSIWAASASWWQFLIVSYTLGAWLVFCNIVLAHDALHGLVFKNLWLNRLVGVVAFSVTFLGPFPAFWQTEHNWHHTIVVDKVVRFGSHQNSIAKKIFASGTMYLLMNVMFSAISAVFCVMLFVHIAMFLIGLRKTALPESTILPPFNRFPKTISWWFLMNAVACYSYQAWLVYKYGFWALGFQIISNTFANGFHPLGMRNVQEHYYIRKDQPTTSVYPNWWTNFLCMNIGYHVEHHDFNTIPHSRLYRVREIAPEFYNNLFYYKSYTEVLLRFFTDSGIPLSTVFEGNPIYEALDAPAPKSE